MDELSEEDKLTVARARKIQRFLSQPFQVAEVFTGHMGKLVPLKETINGFKSILGGMLRRTRTPFIKCYSTGAPQGAYSPSIDCSGIVWTHSCLHLNGISVFDRFNGDWYVMRYNRGIKISMLYIRLRYLKEHEYFEMSKCDRSLSCVLQESTMLCPSRRSTWWGQLRRLCRRPRNWLRSTRKRLFCQYIV